MIFVLGVVAVFHVGSSEFAESKRNLDAVGAVRHPAYPVEVFACPAFPLWGGLATSAEDESFLEMDVDGVAPAAATVFQMPDFELAELGGRRQPARVHCESGAAIGLDRPRCVVGASGTTKGKGSVDRVLDLLSGRLAQGNHLLLAADEICRIHAPIDLIIASNAEF